MALRLSGQTSMFGAVFFVSKSLLGIERRKNFKNLQFWPESLGAVLEYWYIERGLFKWVHVKCAYVHRRKLETGSNSYQLFRRACTWVWIRYERLSQIMVVVIARWKPLSNFGVFLTRSTFWNRVLSLVNGNQTNSGHQNCPLYEVILRISIL